MRLLNGNRDRIKTKRLLFFFAIFRANISCITHTHTGSIMFECIQTLFCIKPVNVLPRYTYRDTLYFEKNECELCIYIDLVYRLSKENIPSR